MSFYLDMINLSAPNAIHTYLLYTIFIYQNIRVGEEVKVVEDFRFDLSLY